jgi:hypothetical protein
VLLVDPPEPTTADDVKLIVRDHCPSAFEAPSRQGTVLRLTRVPSLVAAPCVEPDPLYQTSFPLGRLPQGDYSVTEVFVDPHQDAPPVMLRTHSFRVHPAPSPELLFQGGRFRASARWTLPGGAHGAASAVPLTADTGFFWFLRPANLELTVKLLRACAIDGHYWVFASGLTNVGVTLRVEDALTGEVRTYASPGGTAFEPIQDTSAFDCP